MPATVASVKTFLGLAPARPVDDDALGAAVAAANDTVFTLRADLGPPDVLGATWPARADQAATLYAARLYGRRGSIQGVAVFQDVATTLRSTDPDVYLMLELGPFQPSVVA
jgi:hypothetical protein